MKQNIVTFNGVNYPVVFDLQALTNFEDITKQGFFEANLNMTNNRMAIVIASVLSADKDTKLTIEEMRGKGSFDDYKQIVEAYNVVITLANDFFKRQTNLLILIMVLTILYINNRYECQQEMIEIDRLKKELTDIKYDALTRSSELMEKSRQSRIEEYISTEESHLETSTNRPFLITKD